MRVPEETGAGKTKVTYSFDTWKEGKVKPTTIEIPIKDAREQQEGN